MGHGAVGSDEAAAYTFGDGDAASVRLGMVAALFDPPTRAFVERVDPAPGGTVVDLGCGPGHTTRLLADVLSPDRLVAVERSADFVERTRVRVPTAEVHRGDVTELPLPGAPADVILARLLLAHLPEPASVANRWQSQLVPGGVLLLDEIDAIVSDIDVLREYEQVVTELVASRGALMAAGPALDGFAADAAAAGSLRRDDRFAFPVDPRAAAAMFGLNLTVWRDDPAVDRHRRSGLLDHLAAGLEELATGAEVPGTITWHIRQLAVSAQPT
jgi:trans-aconitate 2-methyltransferase